MLSHLKREEVKTTVGDYQRCTKYWNIDIPSRDTHFHQLDDEIQWDTSGKGLIID